MRRSGLANLIIKRQGEPTRGFELGTGTVVIGALSDCDVTLESPFVSRRHAEIRSGHEAFEVVDVGSRNGTFLNGVQLEPQRPYKLKSGDELLIDNFSVGFIEVSAERPTLPADVRLPEQLVVDGETKEVWIGPRKMVLPPTVFSLLEFLYLNRGRVCSRDEIGRHVWRSDSSDSDLPQYDSNMLDQLINRLRARIEPTSSELRYIINYRGLGYRLFDTPQQLPKP